MMLFRDPSVSRFDTPDCISGVETESMFPQAVPIWLASFQYQYRNC